MKETLGFDFPNVSRQLFNVLSQIMLKKLSYYAMLLCSKIMFYEHSYYAPVQNYAAGLNEKLVPLWLGGYAGIVLSIIALMSIIEYNSNILNDYKS